MLPQCLAPSGWPARRRSFVAAARLFLCTGCAAIGTAGWSLCEPARAFDLPGPFGSDKPPPISATALSYRVEIEARTADGQKNSDAEQALRDASAAYRLRQEPPPDGEGLVRRLQADINPLLDALWGLGRYNAEIDITVGGIPVSRDETGLAAAVRRAESFRNREIIPVKVAARLGPVFKLRTVDVDYPREMAPQRLPRRAFPLKPGDPAISADLRAAQLKLIDWFRSNGHPLAKIADVKATVDHAAAAMDFRLRVEAGPKAGIGHVAISDSGDIDPRVVATHVHLREGEPYSPERLALVKTSIARIPAIGGIRIREGDKLDANGNVPIFIDVTERPKHAAAYRRGIRPSMVPASPPITSIATCSATPNAYGSTHPPRCCGGSMAPPIRTSPISAPRISARDSPRLSSSQAYTARPTISSSRPPPSASASATTTSAATPTMRCAAPLA